MLDTTNANEFVPLFKLFHSMKKREREADNEESHHYPANTIPGEVNLFAVRLFEVMEKKGMKRSEFLLNMQEAGYNMSYKTFGRHIQGYKMHGSILNVNKETGAIPSLSFLEKDLLQDLFL